MMCVMILRGAILSWDLIGGRGAWGVRTPVLCKGYLTTRRLFPVAFPVLYHLTQSRSPLHNQARSIATRNNTHLWRTPTNGVLDRNRFYCNYSIVKTFPNANNRKITLINYSTLIDSSTPFWDALVVAWISFPEASTRAPAYSHIRASKKRPLPPLLQPTNKFVRIPCTQVLRTYAHNGWDPSMIVCGVFGRHAQRTLLWFSYQLAV